MCDHEPLAGPSTDPDGKELQYFSRYEPGATKVGHGSAVAEINEVLCEVLVSLYCFIF